MVVTPRQQRAGGDPFDPVHRVPAPGDVHPEHLAAAEAEPGNPGHDHGGRVMPGRAPAALAQPQPITQPVPLRDPLGGLPPGEVQHLTRPPGQREDDLQAVHHIRLAAGVSHRVPDPDGATRDGLGLRHQAQACVAVLGLDAGAPLVVPGPGGPEQRRPVAPGGRMTAAGVQPVTGQARPAEPARAVLGQQRAGPGRGLQRGHLAGIQPARGHRASPHRGQRPGPREQDQPGTGRAPWISDQPRARVPGLPARCPVPRTATTRPAAEHGGPGSGAHIVTGGHSGSDPRPGRTIR